jgi:hypothetical protein
MDFRKDSDDAIPHPAGVIGCTNLERVVCLVPRLSRTQYSYMHWATPSSYGIIKRCAGPPLYAADLAAHRAAGDNARYEDAV